MVYLYGIVQPVIPSRDNELCKELQYHDNSFHYQLIAQLLKDKRYTPVQKSVENIVPLIDWRWLLALLAGLLTTEWLMRKYNGLT